jgi:hypothetical protein
MHLSAICTHSLYLCIILASSLYRSLSIYRPTIVSTEKEVESLSFSNGIMNVSFDFLHDSRLSLLRISVVLLSSSRYVLACNKQPNTTSSQVNHSNYPSLSSNKLCIAINVSLNIQRNNTLEDVKRRIFAFNTAGLPGDLMILFLNYVNGICLIIMFLSLSLSNIDNQS